MRCFRDALMQTKTSRLFVLFFFKYRMHFKNRAGTFQNKRQDFNFCSKNKIKQSDRN